MQAMTHVQPDERPASPGSGSGRWVELSPKVLDAQTDYTLGTYGDVFIVIWRQDTTLSGVAELGRCFDRFAAGMPQGVGLLTVIEPAASLPSSSAREALAAFMRDNGNRIRTSAVVFEGSGFRAAAVRSVVVGLTMLANQPFPHRVFSTVERTRDWFLEKLGDERQVRSASGLGGAVETIRGAAAAAAVTQ